MRRRCARIEECRNALAARHLAGPERYVALRRKRCEEIVRHRPGIAVAQLVQQLAARRPVAREQCVYPVFGGVPGFAPCLGRLGIPSRHQRCHRAGGSVHHTVHLAQHGAQNQSPGQQPQQPAVARRFKRSIASADAVRSWAMRECVRDQVGMDEL